MKALKMDRMDDTSSPYATFWQRLLAQNIDLTLLVGFFYLYSLVPATEYDAVAFVLISISYQFFFEISPWKATPGKRLMQLKVVQVNESPLVVSSLLRSIGKFISLLSLFVGFVMINMNKRNRGLHDYIAGTVVLSIKN